MSLHFITTILCYTHLMTKQLHIYPTSRALRALNLQHKEQNGFLPTLMRMDEFEKRSILLENKTVIDPLQRILLLRDASKLETFKALKIESSLVRFFTKSDALFKFFEELSFENVNFNTLANADAYTEFTMHLTLLEELVNNYKELLNKNNYTDKAFIPQIYTLNEGFFKAYESIDIHLEGYLSYFELELLENISKLVPLSVHYNTSKFNFKMQDRFKSIGISLPNNSYLHFSLTNKELLKCERNSNIINAKVYAVEERVTQVALVFAEIEKLINSGIPPEEIVLILPDENFKEHFMLFDSHNNLNFAMGYDYSQGYIYKSLNALYEYWQNFDKKKRNLLERYGLKLEKIDEITIDNTVEAKLFFTFIDELGLHECSLTDGEKKTKYNERVYESYLYFTKIFRNYTLNLKEWLFLWLKSLSKISIDDVRGGKITVMGVLETRGINFEAVVIVDFNENIVPSTSSKDQFLNSSVRAFANLPTKNDREALQKQYYKRLLEQAQKSIIVYSTADNKLPSKFLYELELDSAEPKEGQLNLLYERSSKLIMQEPLTIDFNPLTIVWSASRLKTFLECKYKYYYKYILGINEKEQDEMSEGQFLHKVLEHLFDKKSSYSSKEEMQKSLDILIDTLHPLQNAKAQYQKLLWKKKLNGFVNSQIEHFNAKWEVAQREKEFQCNIGGLRFKGRIDRIDHNCTETLVLDYKSGRVEKEPKTLNRDKIIDFQMPIYKELLTGKYQNISLAYLKILENGTIQTVEHMEERKELLEEHLETLRNSTSFTVQKCDESKKCRFCETTLLL